MPDPDPVSTVLLPVPAEAGISTPVLSKVEGLGMFLDKEDPLAVAVTRGWLVADFDDSPEGEV